MNIIAGVMTLILAVVLIASLGIKSCEDNKAVVELHRRAEKSYAHKFAVSNYLNCKYSGLISPSQAACTAQVIVLSKEGGPEFEKQVLAAIVDIGL